MVQTYYCDICLSIPLAVQNSIWFLSMVQVGLYFIIVYSINVSQLYHLCLILHQWFSLSTPVSSTNKTDCPNIIEILLKVALNTINQPTKPPFSLIESGSLRFCNGVITLIAVKVFRNACTKSGSLRYSQFSSC